LRGVTRITPPTFGEKNAIQDDGEGLLDLRRDCHLWEPMRCSSAEEEARIGACGSREDRRRCGCRLLAVR
jgi:hypothetical protein